MGIVKALYLLLMLTYSTNSATLLPYGDNNTNDIEATGMSDDSSFEITITTPLPFYGATYSSLWVSTLVFFFFFFFFFFSTFSFK